MKSFLNFKITFLMISSLVPWPEPSNPALGCSREFSYLVRSFVTKKWKPIFEKFKVDIPISCPLNPERDIYHIFHKSKLQVNSRKWSCSICGKSFHKEPFIDLHMLNRHQDKLHLIEDSVCPADFCDLIRCEVLEYAELSRSKNHSGDYQNQQEKQQTITALVKASPKIHTLNRFNQKADKCLSDIEQCKRKGWLVIPSQLPEKHCCPLAPPTLSSTTSTNQTVKNCRPNNTKELFQETVVPSSKEEELSVRIKKKQSDCKDEDFVQLRSDCARLIGMCTTGLALRLTNQQFFLLRDELNRSVCWHLQCDRYWTEVISVEPNTSTLLLIALAFASAGLLSSYVIVCILCHEPSTLPLSRSRSRTVSSETVKEERPLCRNGLPEYNNAPQLPSRRKISNSSDAYLRRLDSSSYIVEPEMEENSLI